MNALTPDQIQADVEEGCFQTSNVSPMMMCNPLMMGFAMGVANLRMMQYVAEAVTPEINSAMFFAEKGMEMVAKNMGFHK